MGAAGWVTGAHEKYHTQAMDSAYALSLAVVLLILFGAVTKWWDHAGARYSLEWMLAKVIH